MAFCYFPPLPRLGRRPRPGSCLLLKMPHIARATSWLSVHHQDEGKRLLLGVRRGLSPQAWPPTLAQCRPGSVKKNVEPCPTLVSNQDAVAVPFDNRPGNRQPQARTLVLPGQSILCLGKFAENSLLSLPRNTFTLVAHRHLHKRGAILHHAASCNGDGGPARRILDGIGKQ